jgi:sulfopyruvate decarboxylase subunit alpha
VIDDVLAAPAVTDSQEDLLDRRSRAVIAGIEAIDPAFVLHLASSTLKIVLDHFISGLGARDGRRVFAMPREEEGICIATGLELADSRTVLIFQDNGIGNLLTALLTLPQPYHVPLFGVVTRRGGLGEYNSMIHTISERTEALLDAAGVRWFQLDTRTPIDRWAVEIERAWQFSRTTHRPVFVLVNLMGG